MICVVSDVNDLAHPQPCKRERERERDRISNIRIVTGTYLTKHVEGHLSCVDVSFLSF